ncbi:L-lactate permease [Planctomicrobium sp. SH664]|uniref:L-lactate permease n=1 Tax=Planctomicrobium sp. SH664 TaxID=3448125 RepID=UPI003F5B569B
MSPWTQVYTPVADHVLLSALVASLPVVVLLGLLAFFELKAHLAALIGLATALIVAIGIYGMPARLAGLAAIHGALYGLLPIGWIVLNAIFLYDVSVQTGGFEIVKNSIAGLSADRRIQALLIAFSFGAFIEGAAGFGTPVAISAAMLVGLGFRPLQASVLALIGNTAPVAYGALGTPLIALAAVTGLPLEPLSAAAGRILPLFSLMVPFWIVAVMTGRRGIREVWPACLVSGCSFALMQFLVSNYHGPWLVDIVSALVSMLASIVLLRFWQPKTVWLEEGATPLAAVSEQPALSRGAVARAWLPWVVMSVLVFLWGIPTVKKSLNEFSWGVPSLLRAAGVEEKETPGWLNRVSHLEVPIPLLHQGIVRVPPVVDHPLPENAVFNINWLSATGTSLLLAAVLSGLLLRMSVREIAGTFATTLWRVRYSLLTISAMLALGFTTKAAGLDATMGLAFASTGVLFPLFSALLGWLGVALTGSDTSSNVLFGGLQKITAQQLGLNPILTAAANTTGGVMGKMIDAQSLVVASVATRQEGEEGTILRAVFWHSLTLAVLVGLVILLYARVLPADWIPAAT